jgi:tRNA U34 5-methylaminomethyl-2-thiouridine-forming methyltransferase MnmC
MTYELKRQHNGAFALFRRDLGETMHPQLGPREEARRVYVQGARLEELLTPPGAAEVVVFDVGLGGAANAIAALSCRRALGRQGTAARPLRVVSFEQDLDAPRFALAHAQQLDYLAGFDEALAALMATGAWEDGEGLAWELRVGDFTRWIQEEPRRADVIFFDPFSPRSNPAMWSLPVLTGLYGCRRMASPTRLATYSSALSVRAGLLLAGFYVGDGPALEGSRRATLASTDFSDLRAPLGPRWLARWRRDSDPWPSLTPAGQHRHLREALLAHPQWSQFPEEAAKPIPPARARTRPRKPRHS